MGPLKHYYGEEIRRWQFQNRRGVSHYEVCELLGNAYLQVQTGKIAAGGFRATGLYPVNRDIFNDVEFHVTEDEDGIEANEPAEIESREETPPPFTRKTTQSSSSSSNPLDSTAECSTSSTPSTFHKIPPPSTYTTVSTFSKSTDPGSQLSTSSTSSTSHSNASNLNRIILPEDISPIPKLKTTRSNRGRPRSSAELITGSPYKRRLENCYKGKRKETSNNQQNKQKNSKAENKSVRQVSNENCKQTQDEHCMYCKGKFSVDRQGEKWIQCIMCEDWCHEDCSGVEKETFICDYCE